MLSRCGVVCVWLAVVAGTAERAVTAPRAVPASAASIAAPQRATVSVLEALDRCVARLDAREDTGIRQIAARCPTMMRQLQNGDWAAWLPVGWNASGTNLSIGSLREL